MSKKLNASIALANAPSLVAQIINEPVVANLTTLCDTLVTSFAVAGGSLHARRLAFDAAYRMDDSKKEVIKAATKLGHIVGKFVERDNVSQEVATVKAKELQAMTVPQRIATAFDATRNFNHIYVSAGVAYLQLEIDTGHKVKPTKNAKGTTVEDVVAKDQKVTPTATTNVDMVAWFKANGAIVGKYLEVNKSLLTTPTMLALANIATTYADSVKSFELGQVGDTSAKS